MINNELKDLHKIEFSNKIISGCDPCKLKPVNCKNNGVCKSENNIKSDFTCECQKGYAGELCEYKEKLDISTRNISYRAIPIFDTFDKN